MRKQI